MLYCGICSAYRLRWISRQPIASRNQGVHIGKKGDSNGCVSRVHHMDYKPLWVCAGKYILLVRWNDTQIRPLQTSTSAYMSSYLCNLPSNLENLHQYHRHHCGPLDSSGAKCGISTNLTLPRHEAARQILQLIREDQYPNNKIIIFFEVRSIDMSFSPFFLLLSPYMHSASSFTTVHDSS